MTCQLEVQWDVLVAGEKEVWSSWLEHPVRVQLGRLECQCPVLSESPRRNRSEEGWLYRFNFLIQLPWLSTEF